MKFTEQPATGVDLRGAMANTLGELVDGIAALNRMEAAIAAQKSKLIDDARQWSELIERSVDDNARGWSSEVRAHRVLVSELACAL